MTIRSEPLPNGAWLVEVTGRLDHKQTPDLDKQLKGLFDDGYSRFLIDLSAVIYVNSGGLRSLVTAWRRSQTKGGVVELCGLSPRVEEVFVIVGFHKVFTIYPSVEDGRLAFDMD